MEGEIISALEQFSIIKDLIGVEKVLELFKRDEKSPFIYYLEKSLVDEDRVKKLLEDLKDNPGHIGILILLDLNLNKYYIMKHLNSNLAYIKSHEKLDRFIEHLLDSSSFWQGYTEIEISAYLKKLFGCIELEPLLPNGKSVDVKYSNNGQDYYIEITVPKAWYKYEKEIKKSAEKGIAVELEDSTDRACEKILDEVAHFDGVLDDVKSIIIINLNETEFDEIEIEDCLLGISKLVFMKNSKTGEFIGTRVDREKWTAFDIDERLQKIGLIISYKRDFALNGNVVFNKKMFIVSFSEKDYVPLEKLFE